MPYVAISTVLAAVAAFVIGTQPGIGLGVLVACIANEYSF